MARAAEAPVEALTDASVTSVTKASARRAARPGPKPVARYLRLLWREATTVDHQSSRVHGWYQSTDLHTICSGMAQGAEVGGA